MKSTLTMVPNKIHLLPIILTTINKTAHRHAHTHTQTPNIYEQNLINLYYFTSVALWTKAAREYICPCKKAVRSLPASGHKSMNEFGPILCTGIFYYYKSNVEAVDDYNVK